MSPSASTAVFFLMAVSAVGVLSRTVKNTNEQSLDGTSEDTQGDAKNRYDLIIQSGFDGTSNQNQEVIKKPSERSPGDPLSPLLDGSGLSRSQFGFDGTSGDNQGDVKKRFSRSPRTGHNRGVVSLAWCLSRCAANSHCKKINCLDPNFDPTAEVFPHGHVEHFHVNIPRF